MKEVVKIVAEYYKLPVFAIYQTTRARQIVSARKVAMYLIRENSKLPFADIGKFFEKDHATVIHACNSVKAHSEVYPAFASDISFLLEYTATVKFETPCHLMHFRPQFNIK